MMFLLPFLPSLPPSIPLSHYVLLFHITAKQFEAPKGSPPILAPSFLPSPHSSFSWYTTCFVVAHLEGPIHTKKLQAV